MIPLCSVCHSRAVVFAIEDAVRISIGLVKPNANIVATVTGRAMDTNVRSAAEHEGKQGGAIEGKREVGGFVIPVTTSRNRPSP